MKDRMTVYLRSSTGLAEPETFTQKELPFKEGMTYEDLVESCKDEFKGTVILAKTKNNYHELGEEIEKDVQDIIYLDTTDRAAEEVYVRSLSFLFIAALKRTYPKDHAVIVHSISGGLYVQILRDGKKIIVDSRMRDQLEETMREMIERDLPINRYSTKTNEVIDFFRKKGRYDKVDILFYRKKGWATLYELGGYHDSFYGYMAPSAAYIGDFQLVLFDRGIVLMGLEPDSRTLVRNFKPQPMLSETYKEEERWAELQGIYNVSDLNRIILDGYIGEAVRMTETLQDHRIMEIAEEINRQNKRIVLIVAPSCSGKTSFAYKLRTSLQVLGWRPIQISLDDYFLDRDQTPLDENGEKDFESLKALDLKQFNRDLKELLAGRAVERIRYDFVKGKRIRTGETLKLRMNSPVIIEGIHALNPALIEGIEDDLKYKIFLSVTTQIGLDDHNRISTTDLRLLRRIARDKESRDISPRETILNWPKVLRGEKRNIFPYEEEADLLFNSAFIYEISALKPIVLPELLKIPENDPAYPEAMRLVNFLQYFVPMEDRSDIVNTSILREFIGGSKIVN